ncbi:hypothetical protein C8Q80DRAFT_1274983 [Daedaleopsis nitida]|nr:hypothetical protein C8Q80DRAFT_1274983 [Daedaleopsis nitida]
MSNSPDLAGHSTPASQLHAAQQTRLSPRCRGEYIHVPSTHLASDPIRCRIRLEIRAVCRHSAPFCHVGRVRQPRQRRTFHSSGLWDAAENGSPAVNEIFLSVFVVAKTPGPLLSITVSTTLRNKSLAMTAPCNTLATLIRCRQTQFTADDLSVKSNGIMEGDNPSESDEDEILSRLREVNSLEGGLAGGARILL